MYLWEILLLKISVSHCQSWSFSEKHMLESTFAKFLILLVHVEIPEVFYHLNIHLHYQVFTKFHVPSLVREFLLYWEDTCEDSTVTVKVIDMINIHGYLLIPLPLQKSKCMLFFYSGRE
jgi:hypothetical protein